MRQLIKDFVSLAADSIPIPEPIYEFGSLRVPGQEDFADLRPLFPQQAYIGCDMREGIGVDTVLNLHEIDLQSESVGTVLCLDTLEHVEYPHQAMKEVYRILKPNGVAIMSSVMNFPIHDYPYDYWRFTPEAFKSILKPFADAFVGFAGNENFPHTVVGIGFKGKTPPLSGFSSKYDNWQRSQAKSIEQLVKVVTPPILLPVLSLLVNRVKGLRKRKRVT
ncbi:MAG: class I SAM-dependent methyltransferase [Deltaproteobacteria bacterium]|nr:class I SAM-dependent methyltransferase [Deltaproteobacteria bacterium]